MPTLWMIHLAIEIVSESLCCIILGHSYMFCIMLSDIAVT